MDEINRLIKNLYSDKKYAELEALSKLFSVDFLRDLENLLNKGRRNEEYYKDKIDVSVGWIDKIPLASFKDQVKDYYGNIITSKVELGDFLIVYTHSLTYQENGGNTIIKNLDSRAILIQAKISNVRNPVIPIGAMDKNKVTSTSKELALLSDWPTFDLFKASRSKLSTLSKIKLDKHKSNRKFAGYFNKQWDIGNPIINQSCNETFGELISKMMDQREGQFFTKNNPTDDWSRLINKIIELCGKYEVPGYIFGKGQKRYIFTNKLFSTPIPIFHYFLRKKKFPVFVINRIFSEGNFK